MDVNGTSLPLSTEVQRFGAMIACDLILEEITHVSDTIADVFGQAPDRLLGASLASVTPKEFLHDLRNIMSLRHFDNDRHFAGRYDLPTGAWDVSVSHSITSGHVVIEFEPPADNLHSADDFSIELRHLSGALRTAVDDRQLLKAMAAMLRFATGYNSALVYRFDPNGGEVIAEVGSLAGQRFLGDRLIYLENHSDVKFETCDPILHFTADADQGAASILALDSTSGGLDLARCHLRGTPRTDIDELTKMGARAALTVPIFMSSGIWGMALLLSQEPQTPSRYVRQLCDALALVVCDRLEILAHSTSAQPTDVKSQTSMKVDLSGKSALVVEDNRLIAADLKLTLLDLGFATVDVFVDEASALEYLGSNQVDLAVLDVLLEGLSTSFNVAGKLAEVGTPFLFVSSYGAGSNLPDWLGPRPVVLKPASRRDLSVRIDELFGVSWAGQT